MNSATTKNLSIFHCNLSSRLECKRKITKSSVQSLLSSFPTNSSFIASTSHPAVSKPNGITYEMAVASTSWEKSLIFLCHILHFPSWNKMLLSVDNVQLLTTTRRNGWWQARVLDGLWQQVVICWCPWQPTRRDSNMQVSMTASENGW